MQVFSNDHYSPEELTLLDQAFCYSQLEAADRGHKFTNDSLAKEVIKIAATGERDVWRLGHGAVNNLAAAEFALAKPWIKTLTKTASWWQVF